MRFIFLTLFSLCFIACIDEYSDTIVLYKDGSATFSAEIYPSKPDSGLIDNIKTDYDSIPGIKFDSAWFVQKDSLYSLNFKITFENLFTWQGYENFDKDFIGNISLKKIGDSVYSFKREINPNIESEDGAFVPEESISPFALEQVAEDSAYFEYTLILPQGAIIIKSEPIDSAYTILTENPEVLRWKFLTEDALSKRIILKADFSLPQTKKNIHWTSLFGIAIGCIIMLLAIIILILKLRRLSGELKNLENAERNLSKEE